MLKRNLFGWALMLVPLSLFAFFVWVPMIRNFILSFQDNYFDQNFVGFANFQAIFADPAFSKAVGNTFLYILFSILIGYLVPVLLGFLLSEVFHFSGIFRVLLYLPGMISGIAVVFLFSTMYGDSSTDLFNVILKAFGGEAHPWKGSTDWIIPLIVLAMTWRGAGSTALIYLSSFQSIDESMYEAARMDGATPWQRFLRITIPSLKATLITLFVLQIISVFQVFYEPLVIGPKGGPLNSSMSLLLLSYLYAFEDFEHGKSAATAMVLVLIIAVFTLAYRLLLRALDGGFKKGAKK
ncbi:MAG: sugar ABC transporter permease [Bacilli bacterium]|nr:sugar ABC transporter permease [Bacilli bacterium]MDY6392154.1 sugar ABC transporter permease [Bacilli bacterium]